MKSPKKENSEYANSFLDQLFAQRYTALDLLPGSNIEENLVALLLGENPYRVPSHLLKQYSELRSLVENASTAEVKVVVFGGGTGLSTIIGGDSRRTDWAQHSSAGLKCYFPHLHSVVCVTDDGGSTGELRKDLPLIALGDLRHVLLAALKLPDLARKYGFHQANGQALIEALHVLFNYRFTNKPRGPMELLAEMGIQESEFPEDLFAYFVSLIDALFTDSRLCPVLQRPQCVGNLLLASAIYKKLDTSVTLQDLKHRPQAVYRAIEYGLGHMAIALGLRTDAVLPAMLNPAELCMLYSNGVLVTSENKSGEARRRYPVDRTLLAYYGDPALHPRLLPLIAEADIILFAPGSLYTSIMPILQIPGVPEAVRANKKALKLLVANIWVQKGETDATRDAPDRKFYVSDLIYAYHRNIPGGIKNLFSHVIALNMADIPGSVLQQYALEEKQPIFLDRELVHRLGLGLVEATVFSPELLRTQKRIQHDPDALGKITKTLWALWQWGLVKPVPLDEPLPKPLGAVTLTSTMGMAPCYRFQQFQDRLRDIRFLHTPFGEGEEQLFERKKREEIEKELLQIFWQHPDIPLAHLDTLRGISLVSTESWKRNQEWDNVFSFYDPTDGQIKIRKDVSRDKKRFEAAFLIALGQSVLGNYAQEKRMEPLYWQGNAVGLLYRLRTRTGADLNSFLSPEDINSYLQLTRMHPSPQVKGVYTRAINLTEGFTPPGLFFGLFYAWYLDNTLIPTIDYKMSIMRHERTSMLPEQTRLAGRRQNTVIFFRERVFRQEYIERKMNGKN